MKKTMMAMALAATVAGLGTTGCYSVYKNCASAVSPDGKNKICLSFNPLAYTVTRDGKTVVAKSPIGMTIDGKELAACPDNIKIASLKIEGEADAAVYKKAKVDLSANETLADFGDWAIRLVARNDGVAYRFETRKTGEITVNDEKASFRIPNPKCKVYANFTHGDGFWDKDRMSKVDPLQNSWERFFLRN